MIATAGSAKKLEQAAGLGADAAVDHHRDDLVASVRKLTDGRGVDIVVEHVGGRPGSGAFDAWRAADAS